MGLRLVGDAIFYSDGPKVYRMNKDGSQLREHYTSADLVGAYVDSTLLVTIESPTPPLAVLKVMPLDAAATGKGLPAITVPTNWNAGGSYVFGSDTDYLYVMADVEGQGDTIYRLPKATPAAMTALATYGTPLADPQLAGSDVWFVRDARRVFKVTQTGDRITPAAPATEVFGIGYADCRLAVSQTHAFCSTGTALEQRDLMGGNAATVLDAAKAASPFVVGIATAVAESVFVRSLPSTPTDAAKNGIRAVPSAGGTPRTLACGRDVITSIAVDATTVVWAEKKGIFSTPR